MSDMFPGKNGVKFITDEEIQATEAVEDNFTAQFLKKQQAEPELQYTVKVHSRGMILSWNKKRARRS